MGSRHVKKTAETSQCPETTLTHGSARRGVEREKLGVEIMA
jgi:hypothetical protein